MNETITSASNPTVKQLRKLLSSSKERRDTNRYVAEGIHLVRSFLTSKQTPLQYICAESALKNPEISLLDLELGDTSAERSIVADSLFESVTHIHASVGIVITFSPKMSPELNILNSNSILLENIQDPGNIGTILRTCAAVGIEDVMLSSDCASPWSPKALRAGMGAQFSLTIHEDVDLINLVKSATIPTLATMLSSDSESLFAIQIDASVAWLFGNEGQGISDELAALVSNKVHIPQTKSSVESLNVAAAAAICLYEQYRQNSL